MASDKPMRQQVEEYISTLQDEIVNAFEVLDPSAPKFRRDAWVRPQGGRGVSCVFAVPHPTSPAAGQQPSNATTVLEKAGVNISIVHGSLPPAAVRQMRADHGSLQGLDADAKGALPFFAAGISLVIHPRNPHAPTVHANYRYFEIADKADTTGSGSAPSEPANTQKPLAWWFGGGSDLTPSYLYEPDAVHFHATLRDAAAPHGAALYPVFKQWCDEYFYLPHRGEARGIGGIFFDDLCDEDHKTFAGFGEVDGEPADKGRPRSPEAILRMVKDLGNAFVPSYIPILKQRTNTPHTAAERRWQLLRRGRYVEFNLVYDRGTRFGLLTPGARIESVLMSLPEEARWEYYSDMGGPGTREGEVVEVLQKPKAWLQ
ncbi:Coproporphyrinogen oxidase [Daedalea quercina L-15889]|uniref:coproporphyrinogen oxidase n=1 Tax=Daedalea quercina L-15889 TaxID=1314783 RepID=A0A165QJ73_9APHY|nr:Coproporphyrinogen oxidase [Daedalea quercina L-15889]